MRIARYLTSEMPSLVLAALSLLLDIYPEKTRTLALPYRNAVSWR